jgi:hypothetical protein
MTYPGHRFAITLFASVLVVWLAAMFVIMRMSALSPDASGKMLVVFEPGTTRDQAFAAITRAGASPLRETSFGFIWVVDGVAGNIVAQGALGTYRDLPISPVLAGCVAVADAKLADTFGLR